MQYIRNTLHRPSQGPNHWTSANHLVHQHWCSIIITSYVRLQSWLLMSHVQSCNVVVFGPTSIIYESYTVNLQSVLNQGQVASCINYYHHVRVHNKCNIFILNWSWKASTTHVYLFCTWLTIGYRKRIRMNILGS